MNLMKRLFGGLSTIYNRLTTVNKKERLNTLSFIIIILLDLFLLSAVFQGLSDHSSQLVSPEDYFPTQYRRILLEQKWSVPSQQLDSLQNLVLTERYNYYHKNTRTHEMHPACEKIDTQFRRIKYDKQLQRLFEKKEDIEKKQSSLNKEINRLRSVPNSAVHLKRNRGELADLEVDLQTLRQDVFKNTNVLSFLSVMTSVSETEKQVYINEIRDLNFWYPVKLLFYQLLFLFPLLLITYYWSLKAVRNESHIQVLVATHLMVITSIPIIVRLIDVITELIPDTFLKDFLALLETLHIIALWHYFVIFFFVLLAGYLVKVIQKKSKERAEIIQYKKIDGNCYSCQEKLPSPDSPFCPYCGSEQMHACESCGNMRYSISPHCHHCGHKGEPKASSKSV